MIVELDVSDPDTAARIVQIQQAAYAVEAELMGFWGIPQLQETADEVAARVELVWRGSYSGAKLAGLIAWEAASDLGDETRAGPGWIDIDRLAVHPACSRQGHGRQLVRSVPPARTVIVSTGRANAPAKALYLAEGFSQIGETEVAPNVWTAQFQRKT